MRIYENGEEVASGAQSGTMDINTSSLLIGTRLQLVADTFLGTIDEVGIWSRALSPAEIETVMQGGSTPIEAMSWGNLKARFGH